jgi:NAD(P)-dependent dehydrogenase (short-subunit alcohol dehydrogenase family)
MHKQVNAGFHLDPVLHTSGKNQQTPLARSLCARAYRSVSPKPRSLALLFNNAGTNERLVPLDQLSTDELRSIIAINVVGSFLCK